MGQSRSRAVPETHTSGDQTFSPPEDWDYVRFDARSFAEGSCRKAYRGTIYSKLDRPPEDLMMYSSDDGWIPNPTAEGKVTYPCVVKSFKEQDAFLADAWGQDLRILVECRELAAKFNEQIKPPVNLSFATPALFKVTDVHDGSISNVPISVGVGAVVRGIGLLAAPEIVAPVWIASFVAGAATQAVVTGQQQRPDHTPEEYVCVEPDLEPSAFAFRFTKLNSNSGWFRTSEDADVAHAFSHWTWCHTNGDKLICDLQGVRSSKGWLLTDPAAHSKNGQGIHGCTDCGPDGIEAFFHRHTCNRLCRHLRRPRLTTREPRMPAKRGSSFAWELVGASSMVHAQSGGTCYAHACATVVRAAESRIVGRKVDPFDELVQRIISRHGREGYWTSKVLNEECPPRSLRWSSIGRAKAEVAIQKGHPVLLSFWFTKKQWSAFSSFFARHPSDSLGAIPPSGWFEETSGHAVVIIGQSKLDWSVKNSWGDGFAHAGCFKIQKSLVDSLTHSFEHVFWYEKDLSEHDREAFRVHSQMRETS